MFLSQHNISSNFGYQTKNILKNDMPLSMSVSNSIWQYFHPKTVGYHKNLKKEAQ